MWTPFLEAAAVVVDRPIDADVLNLFSVSLALWLSLHRETVVVSFGHYDIDF